ncbi:MAG: MG2 domain-containing protein, partial [Bacteroidota bacterium]|nr:MG2 domain-containing protein [Bacteroidota bacterium]
MNTSFVNYFCFAVLVFSQSIMADHTDVAISNLRHQVLDYPQEKLYLQLDKPAYVAGDTIWFRGHTVSEAFHLPSALSRGIFVNLTGPDGKLLERFGLLPLDKRLYSSFIALPDYLPEGVYTLQAYSERMAGKRSHAYFTRKIQ